MKEVDDERSNIKKRESKFYCVQNRDIRTCNALLNGTPKSLQSQDEPATGGFFWF